MELVFEQRPEQRKREVGFAGHDDASRVHPVTPLLLPLLPKKTPQETATSVLHKWRVRIADLFCCALLSLQ